MNNKIVKTNEEKLVLENNLKFYERELEQYKKQIENLEYDHEKSVFSLTEELTTLKTTNKFLEKTISINDQKIKNLEFKYNEKLENLKKLENDLNSINDEKFNLDNREMNHEKYIAELMLKIDEKDNNIITRLTDEKNVDTDSLSKVCVINSG